MMFLRSAIERFNSLSIRVRWFLFLSAALAAIWIVTTFVFFSKEGMEVLSTYQVDKIIHFAGGFFSAGFVYSFLGIKRLSWFFVSILFIGIIWEIFELIFLPDQLLRFQREFILWSVDSFFDLVADILGAYFLYETAFVGRE